MVADTGGIVAAINAAEPGHADYLAILESASTVFVTSLVVTEVHHVLTAAGLETVTISSPLRRSTCSTWTPSRPSRRSQREHGSVAERASAHTEVG